MNEEEMQFASPDWQPPGQASARNEVPLPVSSPPLSPNSSLRPALQSASGPAAHEPVSCGAVVAGSILMIVISIVIAAILAPIGSSSSANSLFDTPQVIDHITTFDPGSSSTVQITHGMTPVDVVGGDTGPLTVDIPPATDNQGARISRQQGVVSIALPDLVPTSEADTITVRLPANISQLALSTTTQGFGGAITVSGYTGQLSVQTPGQLILEQDTLQGRSTLSATSDVWNQITLDQVHLSGNVTITAGTANPGYGTIRFQGTLDPEGTYAFNTEFGPLDLTVPANTSLQVHHTFIGTGGSYHSDFSSDTIGQAPWAQVSLTTTDGMIRVNNGG